MELPVIVTKPGGFTWEGVFYDRGDKMPLSVRTHPSYSVLLSAGYIADVRPKGKEKKKKTLKKRKKRLK